MQDLTTQAPHGKKGATTGSDVHSPLPTFVVMSAMQAGTTTLYAWLAEHTDVCMSARKELDSSSKMANVTALSGGTSSASGSAERSAPAARAHPTTPRPISTPVDGSGCMWCNRRKRKRL